MSLKNKFAEYIGGKRAETPETKDELLKAFGDMVVIKVNAVTEDCPEGKELAGVILQLTQKDGTSVNFEAIIAVFDGLGEPKEVKCDLGTFE